MVSSFTYIFWYSLSNWIMYLEWYIKTFLDFGLLNGFLCSLLYNSNWWFTLFIYFFVIWRKHYISNYWAIESSLSCLFIFFSSLFLIMTNSSLLSSLSSSFLWFMLDILLSLNSSLSLDKLSFTLGFFILISYFSLYSF